MTAPTILAFDTTGPHCAAALWRDGAILGARHEDMKRGQAERLIVLIEELLAEQQVAWADLDLIAVGIGPGNFTGIRISVSAARGMALGLGIPAMGVSQFEIRRGPQSPVLLDPMAVQVPGPRNLIYQQDFAGGAAVAAPIILEQDPPVVLDPVQPAPIIAQIAALRWAGGETSPDRPAPLYVKAADAAPPRDPAPVILP